MDLVIMRWSTGVQLSSAVMIAVFFAVLSRSERLTDLRWWTIAWLGNMVALAIAVSFWLIGPPGGLGTDLMRTFYIGGKTSFVVFLIIGAWKLTRPRMEAMHLRAVVAALVLFSVGAGFAISGVSVLGVVQQGALGVLFAYGTVLLLRAPLERGRNWLLTGFALRCLLSFVEAAAYAVGLFPEDAFSESVRSAATTTTLVHSSFDAGTEWLIALGCVLWFAERTQRELRASNEALVGAQQELRRLADRDPLTALANRRTLPTVWRRVQPRGAKLLFFDLDDFKTINDRRGHHVGDLCLKRFAEALRTSFRPDDAIVRYAGDEFLVVANGLDHESIQRRIEKMRHRLAGADEDTPAVRFSVGISELEAGGDPDQAVDAADAAMYRQKTDREEARGR